MKKGNYDDLTYKNIRELVKNNNHSKAMSILVRYLELYPGDHWARIEYIRLLRFYNRLDEALEQSLIVVNNIDENNKNYMYANLELFNNYFMLNDYNKAYYYFYITKDFRLNKDKVNRKQIMLDELFLRKRLNILTDEDYLMDYTEHGYLKNQILSYDEQRAIKHILLHQQDDGIVGKDLFEEELNLKELFYSIKGKLLNSIPTELNNFASKYYFEYPNVSNINLKENYSHKYLMVVAFRDTLEIITMYPVFTNERIENINFLDQKVKTKRISQIDKFNKRYGG